MSSSWSKCLASTLKGTLTHVHRLPPRHIKLPWQVHGTKAAAAPGEPQGRHRPLTCWKFENWSCPRTLSGQNQPQLGWATPPKQSRAGIAVSSNQSQWAGRSTPSSCPLRSLAGSSSHTFRSNKSPRFRHYDIPQQVTFASPLIAAQHTKFGVVCAILAAVRSRDFNSSQQSE